MTPEFAAVAPPPAAPPSVFATRVATLRATLARSHVDLDSVPVISTCGDHHGIEDCYRCEIARDEAGVDPDMVDAVAIAFAHYPSSVLAAAHLAHVSLCKSIHFDHAHGDQPDPAGLASYGDARLMISIDGGYRGEFSIEQVVHHEIFHLIDRATNGEKVNSDTAWHALNPPRFAYRDPAPVGHRPPGFVNSYATTNELEDRATVFEYMMGQPDALCALAAADPLVAAKAKLVRDRVAKLLGDQRLPHCARKPPKKVVPLAPRPPSILGRMR